MIVIPARLASTRFKDKILCDIKGMPMFIATAKNALKVDDVLIAVDDEKVLKIARKYEFKAIMTDKNHQSGTDRINEAVQNFGIKDDEIIINVQADEPFFESENLRKFKDFAARKITSNEAFMASCYKKVSYEDAENPNLVKVVLDKFEMRYISVARRYHIQERNFTIISDISAFMPTALKICANFALLRLLFWKIRKNWNSFAHSQTLKKSQCAK